MRLLNTRLLTGASVAVTALCLFGQLSTASAKSTITEIKKISPKSAPELAPVTLTIKGSNFNTEPGGTTVSIGGEPATSVTCSSSKRCTAVTPELSTGSYAVTVTSNGMTSANVVMFTTTPYSPPVVTVGLSRGDALKFSKDRLVDSYAAIFDFGNVYLDIQNTLDRYLFIEGPTGLVDLPPFDTEGYNIPASPTPYLFSLEEGPTLSVLAETPK